MFRFLTRRDLFRSGNLLAAPALLGGKRAADGTSGAGLTPGPNIYESIGVRPIINSRGTLTIIGGCSITGGADRNAGCLTTLRSA